MKIWKFPIEVTDEQAVPMPEGAKILCVQIQRRIPCIWAMVNPDAPIIGRTFVMAGTGHAIDAERKLAYIGTFQLLEGALVYHVFELER